MAFEEPISNPENTDLQSIVKKEYKENDQTLCFDTIPLYKVVILSLVTGGAYEVILFYSWWNKLKQDFGYKVSPFWRGLFGTISGFWLFPIFKKYFKHFDLLPFNASLLAVLYFIFCWAANKTAFNNTDSVALEIVNELFTIGSIVICIFVQNKINTINERHFPNAKKNNWKLSNTIWTIVFILLFIFSHMPQQQTNNSTATSNTQINQQENSQKVVEQDVFQKHMEISVSHFAQNLKATNTKCALSSEEIAKCFAKNVEGIGNSSVSGNVMFFLGDEWRFTGDGVCNKGRFCNIDIISHDNNKVRAFIPISVDEEGYIEIQR